MAIVIPVITEYSDRGMQAALRSVKNAEGPMNKLTAATSLLGPALATAGIAAGAFAIKLGIDSVQAAIAEEAEITKLSKALANLGFGEQTTAVEAWIGAAARATTFSDSDLRPAMALLAGATDDVTAAQDLLTLAMDISVGTGKDLDTVTAALAKGYDGNTSSLKRLIPGLTQAELESQSLFDTTGELATRFSGQAAAAAATWEGKLGNVTKAFGELQESFGAGFLDGMSKAEGGSDNLADSLYELQDPIKELGKTVGSWLATLATFASNIMAMKKALDDFRKSIEGTIWANVFDALGGALTTLANGPVIYAINAFNNLIDAIKRLQAMDLSMPSVPSIGSWSATPTAAGASTFAAAPTYNITVTGAVDPVGVSRSIRRVLATGDMRSGRGR